MGSAVPVAQSTWLNTWQKALDVAAAVRAAIGVNARPARTTQIATTSPAYSTVPAPASPSLRRVARPRGARHDDQPCSRSAAAVAACSAVAASGACFSA